MSLERRSEIQHSTNRTVSLLTVVFIVKEQGLLQVYFADEFDIGRSTEAAIVVIIQIDASFGDDF